MSLRGKTLFITGGSRGIGLAIALRAARDGANITIAAKTVDAHPKLAGTIFTAAAEIEAAGGKVLPLQIDVRDESAVAGAVAETVNAFGGIDICVNNASAIDLSTTLEVQMKKFDLIQSINTRGTFLTSRACLPYLQKAENPHILTLSPPLAMRADWFAQHLPYTLSKYGMSMIMLGLAEEFKAAGIACNTLWPRTTVATAAVEFALGGEDMLRASRKPEIMAEAAHAIFLRNSRACTGQFFIDDEVLAETGVTDFSGYRYDPTRPLQCDIFVDPDAAQPEVGAFLQSCAQSG